jgi:hypothetical protein
VRVKLIHQSIPSSTELGSTKKKKKKKPTSSSGGARHRKHPFGRHTLAEEDDRI